MKQFLLIVSFLFTIALTNAQHHGVKNVDPSKNNRQYIGIEGYKKLYKRAPDLSDPSNYFILKGDTLIAIDNKIFKSVAFEYRDENFLKVYKSVAFNPGSKNKNGKSHLKFWKTPLKIFFSERVPSQTQKSLKKFAGEIAKGIDSLQISFVKDIDKANYIIYVDGDFEYNSYLDKKEADYYINWNGKSQITKGFIRVDRKVFFNETLLNEKMQELFVASLGYFTATDKINCQSYFSKCLDQKKSFGELDKEILKYHYSYGICKGIDESTFDELHEKAKVHREQNPKVPYMLSHTE